jgi:hypothetical protein
MECQLGTRTNILLTVMRQQPFSDLAFCYTRSMKVVDKITVSELNDMAKTMYGDFVKAVVDLSEMLLVVDAEMHSDEEQYLLEHGSKQQNLWGINLYPKKYGSDQFVEFDSMINIRPRQQNRSRSVENEQIRQRILDLIGQKVES